MTGPLLIYKSDSDPSFHATDAWYCGIPGANPGGYSTQDKLSGPDGDDLIVIQEQFRIPARRALGAILSKQKPYASDTEALLLHAHEFLHCMVRLDMSGAPLPQDLDAYSHPATAWNGIRHAWTHGFPINAFTRLLRWRCVPADGWQEFLAWFEAQVGTSTAQ